MRPGAVAMLCITARPAGEGHMAGGQAGQADNGVCV